MSRLILSRIGCRGCEKCSWFEVVLGRGQDWCQKYDRGFKGSGKRTATWVNCKGFKKAEWLKKLQDTRKEDNNG
jgi:hypothetical protein